MSAKPLWSARDNLDDRREIAYLLTRIPPVLRVRWLKWCCEKCWFPNSRVHPTVGHGTTGEPAMAIYFDFWNLTNEYRLDPLVGLNALIEIVRAWERGHFTKGSPVRLHLPRA